MAGTTTKQTTLTSNMLVVGGIKVDIHDPRVMELITKKAKTKRGYLVKRGEIFQNWKKRYFVLEQGVLSYKPDEKQETPVIKAAKVVNVITWNGRDNGLCVKLDTGRDLYIEAESENKRDAWYDAVENHVQYNKLQALVENEERRKQKQEDEESEEDDE